MANIFRFISVVAQSHSVPAVGAQISASPVGIQCRGGQCNYSNNYYGDQVCQPEKR
jgi:hypothetical protein